MFSIRILMEKNRARNRTGEAIDVPEAPAEHPRVQGVEGVGETCAMSAKLAVGAVPAMPGYDGEFDSTGAAMKIVNEVTDAFDERLDRMQAAKVPQVEIDAAIAIYERLRTAQAICQALVPGAYSESAVVALLTAISDEARARGAQR
jgi:hypothetical protein